MRIRIDLAYDGTDFKGWARQPGLRTVEEELETALTTVLRTSRVRVTCAGRTDAGVHARGQVCHIDVDEDVVRASAGRMTVPPLEALVRRLNGVLPGDVVVRGASEALPGFDARFSAIWRRYAYRLVDDPAAVDPLHRHHVLAWPRPIDVDLLNSAAVGLIGLNDFASFCKLRAGATTVRTLLDLHAERTAPGEVAITVRADAFCHNMVRALMGCLLAVGDGRRPPEDAVAIMTARRRDPSVTVVAPRGLTLEEVGYPAPEELARQAEVSRATRAPIGGGE